MAAKCEGKKVETSQGEGSAIAPSPRREFRLRRSVTPAYRARLSSCPARKSRPRSRGNIPEGHTSNDVGGRCLLQEDVETEEAEETAEVHHGRK